MGNTIFPRGFWTGAIALLMFLAAVGGCSPKSKVSYQFDSKTDFAAFKTYAVEPTKSPTLDLRVLDGKPMAQVVQESIEKQLDAKGLRKVTSGPADLLVRWKGVIEYDAASGDVGTPGVNVDLNKPDSGPILDTGGPSGEGVPEEVARGGVKIDLINSQSKQVVWRGGVGSVLQSGQPDPKRIERINTAMAKLFANYPPKPAPAR